MMKNENKLLNALKIFPEYSLFAYVNAKQSSIYYYYQSFFNCLRSFGKVKPFADDTTLTLRHTRVQKKRVINCVLTDV